MRSTGLIAAIMTVVIAMEPLTAQGKGKGGGNDDGSKGRSGNAVQGQPGNRGKENKTAERARPSPNDGRNERAESKEPRRGTSSDRRIERQQEREFAGDVDLPGRARSRAVGRSRFVRSVVIDEVRPSVRRFFVDVVRPVVAEPVGRLARDERDAWVNWPARVAAMIAAELEVDAHKLHTVLERQVREHLNELAEVRPNFR